MGISIVFIGVLVYAVVRVVIRDNGRKYGGSNRKQNRNNSADNYFFPGADPNLFTGDSDNHSRNHHDGNSGNGGHKGHNHGGSSWDSNHHGGHGGWDGGGHSHGGGWDGGGHSSGGDFGGGGGDSGGGGGGGD